jgi:hypothetical protein
VILDLGPGQIDCTERRLLVSISKVPNNPKLLRNNDYSTIFYDFYSFIYI